MLRRSYAKYYAIIYFWLRLPATVGAHHLWDFGETVERSSAQAACSVIQTYFAPLSKGLQIRFATSRAQNFLDELLSCMPVTPVTIVNAIVDRRAHLSCYGYNLLLIDDVTALNAMELTRKSYDVIDVEQYFLISVLDFHNSTAQERNNIETISNYFWRNLFIDVKILFSLSKNVIDLYEYRPFTSGRQCKQPTVIYLNTLINDTWLKPSGRNSRSAKIKNLHGCPLRIATWNSPPFLSYFHRKTGLEQFGDFEGRLIVELAKKLNFTVKVVVPRNNELRGTIFKNGTTNGAIKMLQQGEADFSLGCFRYSLERRQLLSSLLPYYQTSQVYGVNLNQRRLSSTQILAFAFDAGTWFCLILSLQITMAFTYFLYRRRSENLLARNILGRSASTAYVLNILGVSLGIPLNRLPATNFTRYVVVLWYFYGLVMRTAYLSLLFRILQSNLYVKPPKSFDDLMSEHYKLVMIENTYVSTYALLREDAFVPKVIIRNISDQATFDYMAQHPTELLASVSPREFLLYHMARTKDARHFAVLPQSIFSHHVTMYLPKFSYLTRPFNGIVQRLRHYGLIEYWAKQSLNLTRTKRQKIKTAKGITISQLLGIFRVYQIFITISFITFCLEWLCFKRNAKMTAKSKEILKK